jgi:hypothetical protein
MTTPETSPDPRPASFEAIASFDVRDRLREHLESDGTIAFGEHVAAALAAKSSAELARMQLYNEAGAAMVEVLCETRDSLRARLAIVENALARFQWLAEEIERREL